MGTVVALADEALDRRVLRCESAKLGKGGSLVDGVRERHGRRGLDGCRDGRGGKVLQGGGADHAEHGGDVVGGGGDVAMDEAAGGFEGREFVQRVEAGIHHSASTRAS